MAAEQLKTLIAHYLTAEADAAEDFCNQYGLTLKKVYDSTGNHKDGDIIKQSKPEGYQVTQGTTLTITIYKAPDDSEKCNPNEEVCD